MLVLPVHPTYKLSNSLEIKNQKVDNLATEIIELLLRIFRFILRANMYLTHNQTVMHCKMCKTMNAHS